MRHITTMQATKVPAGERSLQQIEKKEQKHRSFFH